MAPIGNSGKSTNFACSFEKKRVNFDDFQQNVITIIMEFQKPNVRKCFISATIFVKRLQFCRIQKNKPVFMQ